jgi:hypothetical protein
MWSWVSIVEGSKRRSVPAGSSASKVWRESKGRACAASPSAERSDAPKISVTS